MPRATSYQKSAIQNLQKPGSTTVHRQRKGGYRTLCGIKPVRYLEVDAEKVTCRRCLEVIYRDPNLPAPPWLR
jgi:hypothetical protein